VTFSQYLAYCATTALAEPPRPWWWNKVAGTKDSHPVVMVSWRDARSYCDWAKLRLPSEPEWEKAARGTDGRTWPWGNEWDHRRCNFADASCPLDTIRAGDKMAPEYFAEHGFAWDREHSDGYPYASPVGSFPEGVSPYGALDVAGNVNQWCEDWYDEAAYLRYAAGDLAPPREGSMRVYRGGGWYFPAQICRPASRGGGTPDFRAAYIGFRVCLGSG
jgi:formylglycine-generating enzyme required for sulfatase activity